jgi:hypothetical protein
VLEAGNEIPDFELDPASEYVTPGRAVLRIDHSDDGQILLYEWDIDGDGSFEERTESPFVRTSFDSLGTKQVRVRVTDNNHVSVTKELAVTVVEPPEPTITVSPEAPFAGQTVRFEATDEGRNNTEIESYAWDLPGEAGFDRSGSAFTTAFSEKGFREVTLRVTDTHGLETTVTKTVQVQEVENEFLSPVISVLGVGALTGAGSIAIRRFRDS